MSEFPLRNKIIYQCEDWTKVRPTKAFYSQAFYIIIKFCLICYFNMLLNSSIALDNMQINL